MSDKLKKFVTSLGAALYPVFLEALKDKFVKLALKKLLGTAAKTAGFKVWLVTFIAEEVFEDVGEPVAELVMVKMGYGFHKVEGKLLVKRLKEAESGEAYRAVINRILS